MANRREPCVDLESLDGGTLLEHLVALEPQALEWLTERWRVFRIWQAHLRPMRRPPLVPLIAGTALVTAGLLLIDASPLHAEPLYTLTTLCSVAGAPPSRCTVEAVDQGSVTLYRHRIGKQETVIGISEDPYVRMGRWNPATSSWQPLSSATARLSANTVCFNGTDLCVVNPNYLNSLRQEKGAVLNGRDLLKVTFGSDGRINAYCYDDGCPSTAP